MKRILSLTRALIIPLCFIFLYYGNNAGKVAFRDILLTLIITVFSCCLFFGIFQALTKSLEKTILLSGIFYFFFFNFDNITRILFFQKITTTNDSYPSLSFQNARIITAILLGFVFGLITLFILKRENESVSFKRANNFFLIGIVGALIGAWLFRSIQSYSKPTEGMSGSFYLHWTEKIKTEVDLLRPTEQLPDIYYIILDGYGREDILKEIYGYEDQSFLDSLQDLGFTISQESLANYKQTDPSISSLLNMEYINWVGDEVGRENPSYFPLYFLIDHNRVFDQLRRIGYRINTFATGFEATEIQTADVIFQPNNIPNNFEKLMINATPLSIFWDSRLYAIHREQIRYNFQTLPVAGNQNGPDFVFVHIFAPHPPFVFGPNGEDINPNYPYSVLDGAEFLQSGTVEEYKTGYINQVAFINKEVLSVVQKILQTSNNPPVIIIQGDHGPGSELDHQHLEKSNLAERYPILFAYFIPCGNGNLIPQDITPVNSFRYIFNTCFNADLPYLENRQYFSSSLTPYDMIDVTDSLKEKLKSKN